MKIVKNLEKFIQKGKDEVTDKQAEEAFRTIIKWIGENPNREGLLETPKRVAKAFKEYFKGYKQNATSDLLKTFGLPSVLYSKFQEHNYKFIFKPSKNHLDLVKKYFEHDIYIYDEIYKHAQNNSKKMNSNFNKKICIVSPHFKTEDKLFSEDQIRELFKKNN